MEQQGGAGTVLVLGAGDLTIAAAREGTSLPPAYFRAMRWGFWLGWPAFLSLLGIFWLMVFKLA